MSDGVADVPSSSTASMEPLFSRPEYFPVADSTVLSIDMRHGSLKTISKCTLPALIVRLTSPLDNVDYTMFTDFFLVYRKFLTPDQLLDLLEARFQWSVALRETEEKWKKLAEVVLVRTFVLLRHWLSNYFAQDFVTDTDLRRKFLLFINKYSSVDTFFDNIVISLKRMWIQNVKLMWEDIDTLIQDNNVQSKSDWLSWKIQDYASNENVHSSSSKKRRSKLSFHARQSIHNPILRNESMISLLHSTDKIPLPEHSHYENRLQSMRIKERTGSMLLFPENASNGYTTISNDNALLSKSSNVQPKNGNLNNSNNNKLEHLSRVTHISHMMKDIEYPLTPSVDVVIPPTPAKKIEFILQTSYLASDMNAGQSHHYSTKRNLNITSTQSTMQQKGIMGLLSKWKLNHQRKSTVNQPQKAPQVENLIKYVFSISSLDNHSNTLINSASSKFDILSARTIDEVEYLISVENELLSKLENRKLSNNIQNESDDGDDQDYSVMDNLNLYKTVSSIANSVISLSKTLNGRPHKSTTHLLSPSMSAVERRNLRSSAPMMYSYNNSHYSITNALIGMPNSKELSGPKRLIFHDSKRNSPTKQAILTSNLKDIGEYNGERDSMVSVVTYDSEFSNRPESNNEVKTTNNVFMDLVPTLKRKDNITDLRKFNFERQESEDNTRSDENNEDGNEDIASLITAYEDSISEVGSLSHVISDVKRPTSGRISISRNSNVLSPVSYRFSLPKSPLILGNQIFQERDNALAENQQLIVQLENATTEILSNQKQDTEKYEGLDNESDSQSISTNLLFASAHASPEKLITAEENVIVEEFEENITPNISTAHPLKLSDTPSIRSIVSHESMVILDGDSIENEAETKVSPSLRDKFHLTTADTNDTFDDDMEIINYKDNKYLFSPDNDGGDYASPEKNLDDLKQQFIDQPSEQESDSFDIDDSENKIELTPNSSKVVGSEEQEITNNEIDEKKLKDIINGVDDSMDGSVDPVDLALMKLEGTYKNSETAKINESSTNSTLAREVQNFEIVQTGTLPDTARKRQSMFIQRRRNTMIEKTARNSIIEDIDSEARLQTTDEQIRDLLNQYQLSDSRLQIDNVGQHISFILMYDSKSVAKQLTLIEREILSELDWKDLLDLNMQEHLPQFTSWLQLLVQNENLSGIDLAIARFNLTVDWIISEIVMTQDIRLRRNTIQRFIHIAEHCRVLQNYNTLMEIVLALNSMIVQQFIETWRLVEPGDLLTWEELKSIPSLEKNYSKIRHLLDDVEPLNGCIPFVVLYLSDLSLNAEKRSWIVPNEVLNYNKFQTNVQIVKNFVQKMQWSKFYNLDVDHELLSKCVYITSLSHDEINQLANSK